MEKPLPRIVTGAALDEDARIDASVRPQRLADYIGQSRVKENIEIAIQAARSRGEALDHVLLYGPPGLGKTTLAQIIASELGVVIKTSSGPLLERKGDLTAILTSLEQREVFFLDEIHRLVPAIEEVLYPAMEDYRIDLVIGQGAGARIHPFILNRFTLIGATTRAGLVTAPLRSRFGIVHRLEFYTPEELVIIVRRSASILGIAVDDDGAFEIARRSRGTPRVANRLLRRARDFAQVRAQGHITLAVANEALQMLGVDEHGLDDDRRHRGRVVPDGQPQVAVRQPTQVRPVLYVDRIVADAVLQFQRIFQTALCDQTKFRQHAADRLARFLSFRFSLFEFFRRDLTIVDK